MTNIRKLINPSITSLRRYEGVAPSDQIAAVAKLPLDRIVRLHANENLFPTHHSITKAMHNLPLNTYPDPRQRKIREALASYTGFPIESIIAGAGCDELIELAIRLVARPGDKIADFQPTFGMYSHFAQAIGIDVIHCQRDEEWRLDLNGYADSSDEKLKIAFVASPNNPTGNTISEQEAISLIKSGVLVVIDETYYEFSGKTLAHLVRQFENVMILRSFSKWAGLAGIRIGYAITSPYIVENLFTIRQPYSISVAAEAVATVALEVSEDLMKNVKELVHQRKRMEIAIDLMQNVRYWPSSANFLLCDFTSTPARDVWLKLAQRGLCTRYFDQGRLANSLRISSAPEKETDILIKELSQIMRGD